MMFDDLPNRQYYLAAAAMVLLALVWLWWRSWCMPRKDEGKRDRRPRVSWGLRDSDLEYEVI